MSLQPHQERVVAEKAELDEKITKLDAFLNTEACEKLDLAEQKRLQEQYLIMQQYSGILGERIDAFTA